MEKLDSDFCFSLQKLSRNVTNFYDTFLLPSGLKSNQFILLTFLSLIKEGTFTEIGKVIGMERTTVVRNVNVLEKNELINIRNKISNHKFFEITEKGILAINKAMPLYEEANTSIIIKIGEKLHSKSLSLFDQLNSFKLRIKKRKD